MKNATSLPGGLGYPIDTRYQRISQPNLMQTFGKVESTSIGNLITSVPNQNVTDRKQIRRTPYYYTDIITEPTLFDSNLNLQYADETPENVQEQRFVNVMNNHSSNEDNLNNNYRWEHDTNFRLGKNSYDRNREERSVDRFTPIPATRNLTNIRTHANIVN